MTALGDAPASRFGQTDDANWAGPLLQAVMAADGSNRALFADPGYRQTVGHLCDHAQALGRPHLWGASGVGDRLVGAMLHVNSGLQLWTAGEAVPVVLIDGFVAGPAGLVLCASHVRSLGASRVTAVVVGCGADQRATDECCAEVQVVGAVRPEVMSAIGG